MSEVAAGQAPGGWRASRVIRLVTVFLVLAPSGGCTYLQEKQGELIFRPVKETWWGFNEIGRAHV